MKTAEYLIKDYYHTQVTTCEELAEVFLTKKVLVQNRENINSSVNAYNVLHPYFSQSMETQEIFVVAYLDSANNVNFIQKVCMGGISKTLVDIRLIMSTALLTLCTKIIIAHNHPTGQTKPSNPDKEITKKIKEACNFFDISLVDHIILTHNDYLSFADEGLL